MRFDWIQFLEAHRIPYVTRGHNVTRGNVAIRCPYCGGADPSEHLGLKLDPAQPYWNCWRNAAHRGRNPRRLVQKLLGCNWARAQEIVERQQRALVDAFDEVAARLKAPTPEPEATLRESEPWRKEFRPLPGAGPYAAQFMRYLMEERGFGGDAAAVAERYRLHYCLTGEYAWRLILPFYDAEQRLIGWTGRAVRPGAALRYRTTRGLSKAALYGESWAAHPSTDARLLLITEGPIDAMKLQFYGRPLGCAAVATLGTATTVEQLTRLVQIAGAYLGGAVVVFDADAALPALQLAETLGTFSPRPVRIGLKALAAAGAGQRKDPGALTAAESRALCQELLEGSI